MGIWQQIINPFVSKQAKPLTTKASRGGNVSFITTGSPIYMSLQTNLDFLAAYQTIPELNGIVNKKADAFANAKVCIYRRAKDGTVKKVENHPLQRLFEYPNPIDSRYSFLLKLYKQYLIFGNAFIFNYVPAYGFAPTPENIKNLWLLPPQYTTITPQPQIPYNAKNINEIIKNYRVEYYTNTDYEPQSILHLKDTNLNVLNNYGLLGQSKLTALQYPLSTIAQAYEAQNVGLTKRGASGILSQKGGDNIQNSLLTSKEIEKLQAQYQKYGLSRDQFQILITSQEMTWTQIGSPLKDLMINENITACVKAICDVLNYPFSLMSNGEESKYSNREYANKELYIGATIPEAKQIADLFSRFYGLYDKNEWLEFDFSHIEYLQADKKLEAERKQLEVNTILSINTALAYNQIDYATAVNTLSIIVGISKEEAEMLISQPKPQQPTAEPMPTQQPKNAKINGYEYTRN